MVSRTAAASQLETGDLARRMFWSPRPRRLAAPLVLFTLGLGLPILLWRPSPIDYFVGTAVVFAVPTFGAALLTKPISQAFGGTMYWRRSFYLVAFCLLFFVPVLLAWLPFFFWTGMQSPLTFVLFGYAGTLWLRLVVLAGTAHGRVAAALPGASVQPVLGFAAAFLFFPAEGRDIALALGFFGAFAVAGIAFLEAANSPLRRSFGASGMALMRHALDHFTEGDANSRRELEAFFASFATPIDARVGVIGFRTKTGWKAAVVVPYVHPGPFGTVGGSDLPSKLALELRDLTGNVLVPHGPSTHDYNPATTEECRRLAVRVRELLAASPPAGEVSQSSRRRWGEAQALAQFFGPVGLAVVTRSPRPTDDIEYAVGYAAAARARALGATELLFVDAHNCLEHGGGIVYFGSETAEQVVEACAAALTAARAQTARQLRVGFAAERIDVSPEKGVGPRGIQALVVQAGGQRTAYLLVDGNNMVPGLREQVLDALGGLVDEGEVMTTDNHVVNASMGTYSPVGLKVRREEVVRVARRLVERAVADLEDVEVAAAVGTVKEFKVFGHQNATRLTAVTNSIVSTLRWNTFLSLSFATAVATAMALAIRFV